MSLSGIYKDNSTDVPDYSGCSDIIEINDSVIINDEDISQAVDNYFPESLKDTEFSVFPELMKKVATQIDANSNFITECYNLENLDEDMTYKLASLYDIRYPLYYDVDRLKFLIKNYEKIRNVRGTKKSIYMLFRVLERSEKELYDNDFDNTVIVKIDTGRYRIVNSRIKDLDFAKYMLTKVNRSGIYYEVSNLSDESVMTANTTISSDYKYDPLTDQEDCTYDTNRSEYNSLMTDRVREFTTEYDY